MTPERYQRIGQLFDGVLERAPAERLPWLEQACGDDTGLRAEVEILLANHHESQAFLSRPALNVAAQLLAQSPALEQQRISHYQILSRLGTGGMGEVWLAEDTRLLRRVALKLLPPQFTSDAARVRRFMQEAKAASALNHPNIITVYDIGECEAGSFIVMELVTGRTLRRVITEDNSVETVLSLGQQIAKALSVAHAAGITHRDIKPDNIMVRDDGYVKVLDFGLARLSPLRNADFGMRSEEADTLLQAGSDNPQSAIHNPQFTLPGTVMGTVAYMSPEQARGETVSQPSDVFALGIVLYELATGQHPFQAETLVGYLHAITLQTPSPLTQIKPEIPAVLNSLILQMLQKAASERPTADTVAQTLREIEQDSARATRPLAFVAAETTATPQLSFSASSPSIAVLPFINISNDPDNEYFCDGLAEELLNALSKIEALHVAARTSAFSFKGKGTDIREIGQKLNVNVVLEGSVRKAGTRLRIAAQLISIADGYQLWAERYDRELQDIFDIQDEISLAIVDALKLKLLGAEKQAVTKRYTDNTEAYQLYLQGRFHYAKWTEAGFRRAIEYYLHAIAKEPEYAPAYAALSVTYSGLWYFGYDKATDNVPLAEAAANKALALDQSLAESHYALAGIGFFYEWDWAGVEQEYRRALELNPNYAEAHLQFGLFLSLMGRRAEAIAETEHALALAPLSLQANYVAAWAFWFVGATARLREQALRLLEFEPRFFGGHSILGFSLLLEGRYHEALPELETAFALGSGVDNQTDLGCLYAMLGEYEKAEQMLVRMQERHAQGHFVALPMALIHAALGNIDQAFALLEQAYQQREGVLIYLRFYVDSVASSLKNDPRLHDLLRRIGLPQE